MMGPPRTEFGEMLELWVKDDTGKTFTEWFSALVDEALGEIGSDMEPK